jgi:5-methylcytosine-specific restriction endonuclease McrA
MRVCLLPECGIEFEPNAHNQRYCSKRHYHRDWKRKRRQDEEFRSKERETIYAFREANPDYDSVQGRKSYYKHWDERRAAIDAYSETDYGYALARASSSRHGAIRRNAPIDQTFKDATLANILLSALTCSNCPRELPDLHDRLIDHKIPICFGGKHEESNIQILCDECHWAKSGAENTEFKTLARQLVRAHVAA